MNSVRLHWIIFAFLLFAWAQLLLPLSLSWSSESYYSYGWLVVPMTIFLVIKRIQGSISYPKEGSKLNRRIAWLISLAIGLVGFNCSMLLVEVNPFWRPFLWSGGLSMSFLTYALIGYLYGNFVAKNLLPALFFGLTMIPWLLSVENPVINGFTELVTHFVLEVLQFLGYPAERIGRVILIGELQVGVEEACSGIKSLQALLMMSLFVGEFWMLRPFGRVALVGLSILLTIMFNLVRALILSLLVVEGGESLFNKWHDTIGHITLGSGMILLFLTAMRFEGTNIPKVRNAEPRQLKFGVLLPFVLFTVSPLFLDDIWFNNEIEDQSPPLGWHVDLERTNNKSNFEIIDQAITENVKEKLGFDYGTRFKINENALFLAEGWYYGYNGDSKSNSLGAIGHSPNVCMKSIGAEQVVGGVELNVDLGFLEMPLLHYEFRLPDGSFIQVFWCLWDDVYDGNSEERIEAKGKARVAKFLHVFKRRRSFKRKVLLLGLHGVDRQRAEIKVKELVRGLVTVEKNGKIVRLD